MVRVLILGAGFLGSHLAKTLSHEITCVGRKERDLPGYVACDALENPEKIDALIASSDWVIHLLGGGGPKYFLTDPDAIRDSISLTRMIVSSCGKHNVPLIFTSSIAVYGTYTQQEKPLAEDVDAEPDEIYGTIKLLSEYIVRELPTSVILRIGNMYGYSEPFLSSAVLGLFIKLASEGKGLKVIGENKMDYVHLDDLTRAFEQIIAKQTANEIINLGSGNLVSIAEIATEVKKAYPEDITITKVPAEGKSYADRLLSIAKAKEVLDWKPEVDFSEGVRRTVKAYNNF